MSNPVVTVTNSIPVPSDSSTVRKTYMMKIFDAVKFFLYTPGVNSTNFDPTDMGEEFYFFYSLKSALPSKTLKPEFVADGSWPAVQAAPSGFITTNSSIMPKIITPSTLMVDNGIDMAEKTYSAFWGNNQLLFNWIPDKFNGATIPGVDWFKYMQPGGYPG